MFITSARRCSLNCTARDGAARAGRVTTSHGAFATPAFMPVGTYGTVKAMTPAQLHELGAQIVLANTFHLLLRPGDETVREPRRPAWIHELAGSDPHRLRRISGMEPRRVAQDQRRGRAFQIADQWRSRCSCRRSDRCRCNAILAPTS